MSAIIEYRMNDANPSAFLIVRNSMSVALPTRNNVAVHTATPADLAFMLNTSERMIQKISAQLSEKKKMKRLIPDTMRLNELRASASATTSKLIADPTEPQMSSGRLPMRSTRKNDTVTPSSFENPVTAEKKEAFAAAGIHFESIMTRSDVAGQ